MTARRTEENLQDVPVAIATMSSDDLRREAINSAQDLQGRVPSLVVGTNSQTRNTEMPTIRGQGAQFGSSPGVVIYMSEVPVPSNPVANIQGGPGKFFDLANIQILKGSQGTLFGRNTTGGAMLLEPQKPQEEFSGWLQTGGSSFSGKSYEGVLNAPIIDDTLLMRVGGQLFQRDGFTRDVVTGKDYDSKNYWSARLGLTWRPTDRIENYLLAYEADSDDNGTGTVIERINREGFNRLVPAAIGLDGVTTPLLDLLEGILGPIAPGLVDTIGPGCLLLNLLGPSSNCGQDVLDEQQARGVRRVQLSADPTDSLNTQALVDKFSFELSDNLTLINIASYSTLEHAYRWDLDGSRLAFNDFVNPENVLNADVETLTEELQLQGDALGGALRYVLGGYYEKTEASGSIIGESQLFISIDQGHEQEKESYAPFLQGTYDLGHAFESLSGLSLTLGARYTRDKTVGTASIVQTATGGLPLQDKSFDAEVESDEWTYTAGLDYKFGNHLLYGKVSNGYKTGGISTIAVNPDHYTFEPEFVINYELGQKSDFEIAGMPVRLNTAVYYTDYTDLQKGAPDAFVDPANPSPVPQLGQAIFNVAQAWVAGFELDLTIQPFPGFTFLGTYGYTDAEHEEFSFVYGGATPQLDCTGEEISRGNSVDMSCVPFQGTPKHQYSLSARYLLPLDPSAGDVEIGLTYAWVDEQYSSPTTPPEAEPGAWLPDYGLLNASLSWSGIMGSPLSLQIYGTNLTDELYRVSNSNQWNLSYFQASVYSEPRIIGMNLRYDW